jgi:hypothetical protein
VPVRDCAPRGGASPIRFRLPAAPGRGAATQKHGRCSHHRPCLSHRTQPVARRVSTVDHCYPDLAAFATRKSLLANAKTVVGKAVPSG